MAMPRGLERGGDHWRPDEGRRGGGHWESLVSIELKLYCGLSAVAAIGRWKRVNTKMRLNKN